MANYGDDYDRPVSIYDNLNNMPTTSTPIKSALKTYSSGPTNNATKATKTTATTTGTTSPYADITFKFNENNNKNLEYQLPSNNRNLNTISNQMQPTTTAAAYTVNNNPTNNYAYATPFKPTTTTTPTTAKSPFIQSQPTTSTPIYQTPTKIQSAKTAANANAAAPTPTPLNSYASPTLRPLSQHSQTDLNEATVQSIAAVKAALHDAKSKFFGLNGYAAAAAANDGANENNNCKDETLQKQLYKPKVQILTPPPKPTPKYQNIPENSAIFRNLTPPERPPKPIHFQSSNLHEPTTTELPTSSSSSSPNNSTAIMSNQPTTTPQATKQPTTADSSKSNSPARSLPVNTNTTTATTYKQIPLNDIDVSSPSQAVYMSTTVPQNIKGSKIAGRHTPTRNSLRHSRMLVINNKNYQVIEHPNPMNFKQPNLARWLLILQIIIGMLLACLAIWIFFLAPNTAIQDNPYWSGLVLLIAGILGLILIRYRRIKRHKVRENCFLFLRADSYLLSITAILLCCLAMIFAAIHFARLMASDTICESSNILQVHSTCLCTFNATPAMLAKAKNVTLEATAAADNKAIWLNDNDEQLLNVGWIDQSYKVEYRDLSCQEVVCEWTTLLGLSMALNGLGLLVSFIYIVLLGCQRYDSKRIYTSVQTSTF